MCDKVLTSDIFTLCANLYDRNSALHNKPYALEYTKKVKNKVETATYYAYMPALGFECKSVDCILHLSKTGQVLSVVPFKGSKPIPYSLVGKNKKLPKGVIFSQLCYICEELRTTDALFFEQYDAYVQTGAVIPEFVKILFDYYKKGTLFDDLMTLYPGDISFKVGTKEIKRKYESATSELNVTEDLKPSKKRAKVKELTSDSCIYVEIEGFEDILTDSSFMQFCKDYVTFINKRNNTLVRDICMIQGIETDCINLGVGTYDGKTITTDAKYGYMPTFPKEKGAKIISRADTSNFAKNLRYNMRCKSAAQSISIGATLYCKAAAFFNFLIECYAKNTLVCCSLQSAEHIINVGSAIPKNMPVFDDDLTDYDMISNSLLPFEVYTKFKALVNGRVAKYPFKNDEDILLIEPVVGEGRVTFSTFDVMAGSKFRENVRYWFTYMSIVTGNGVFFPTLNNILDAVSYTISGAKNADLVLKRRESIVNSMCYAKPISSAIMSEVMTNMRRSGLGEYKKSTRFYTTSYNYVNTVAAMLRYNLSFKEDTDYMVLDTTITDRDYLFGRLLALYHYVEKKAWEKRGVTNVTTNAQKFTTSYIQKPAATEVILYERLVKGHLHKLDKAMVQWFENQRTAIYALFDDEEYKIKANKPCGNKWLLGYTLQNGAFYRKSKIVDSDGNEVVNTELIDKSDDAITE